MLETHITELCFTQVFVDPVETCRSQVDLYPYFFRTWFCSLSCCDVLLRTHFLELDVATTSASLELAIQAN
jgi:hypothetical protein